MPLTDLPHPELAPKAHVEGRLLDMQRGLALDSATIALDRRHRPLGLFDYASPFSSAPLRSSSSASLAATRIASSCVA
jgi:hypothetical protein